MKNLIKIFSVALGLASWGANATVSCDITKSNGGGFTTTIESVVCNGNQHTINLLLVHNGCGGPSCKELSHIAVEATTGTYSNVSMQVITGTAPNRNVDMGPNIGSMHPHTGFKFDNMNNIGGGKAGSIRITYTLTGGLQSQRVSAKSGNDNQEANFSIQDFEYVMNCNETGCAPAIADSDGDGVADDDDEYPNDASRAFNTYFPASGFASLAYEDLWPYQGDYDFNDMLIDYKFQIITNADNKVVDVVGTFKLRAFGAGYHNGFGFQFPNANINQALMTATGSQVGSLVSLGANGLEAGQAKPTIIVFEDAFDLMPHPGQGSIGVNTTPNVPYVQPVTRVINIEFSTATYTIAQLGIMDFNPFIFVDRTRGREVHLPDYEPTSLANMSLFGTGDDDSNPAQNRYYKNKNNLPWAITTPTSFDYPKEKVLILDTHLKFGQWAQSNGALFADWYLNLSGYRNESGIFQAP